MARFFVSPSQIHGSQVSIMGDDLKHLTRVLRLGPGDAITVLDGSGQEYQVVLRHVERDQASGDIVATMESKAEPHVEVTVVQGLPKGDRLETVIQKGTELGARSFWPVQTDRSIVQFHEDKAVKKLDRWQKIAQEAAEQSKRGMVPTVNVPISWANLWKAPHNFDLVLVAWEEETGRPIRQVLGAHPQAQKIAVVIGPEGGLTAEEVSLAEMHGAIPVSLGPRIMRTETAGPAALTMILFHYGEYGGA